MIAVILAGGDNTRFPIPKGLIEIRGQKIIQRHAEVFSALGIKTAVGTEAPMKIPIETRRRLRKLGMTWKERSTYEELYKGMFERIMRAHPVDYYWLWDYEGQTKLDKVIEDVQDALSAADAVDANFSRAISGWGRLASHFAELDEIFPKDVIFSCINMSVGNDPVSPQFKKVEGREKWAIPWFEDDKAITVPQLWVGRTRKDAADALEYGCSGFMGLLWRTRVLAPNIAALSTASWDQSAWNMEEDDLYEATEDIVPLGGKIAANDKGREIGIARSIILTEAGAAHRRLGPPRDLHPHRR